MPATAPVPGQRSGWMTVASTYSPLSSCRKQPHATASRAAPGGNGALMRLRGSPIIATLPVATSISTRSITSIRRLQRSGPASEPRRSRSKRPSLPHGTAPGRCHGTVTFEAGRPPVPEVIGVCVTTGPMVAEGSGEAGPERLGRDPASPRHRARTSSPAAACRPAAGSPRGRVAKEESRKSSGRRRSSSRATSGARARGRTRPGAARANARRGRGVARVASNIAASRQIASAMLMRASSGSTPGVTTQAAIAVKPPCDVQRRAARAPAAPRARRTAARPAGGRAAGGPRPGSTSSSTPGHGGAAPGRARGTRTSGGASVRGHSRQLCLASCITGRGTEVTVRYGSVRSGSAWCGVVRVWCGSVRSVGPPGRPVDCHRPMDASGNAQRNAVVKSGRGCTIDGDDTPARSEDR